MLLHRLLDESAQRTPDAVALIEPQRAITYGELQGRANQFADLFLRSGVKRGDRIVLALDNSIELVAAYFGAMKSGGVAVPLPGGPRSDRLMPAIADCTPTVCVLDGAAARELQPAMLDGTAAVFVSGDSHTVQIPAANLETAVAACSTHATGPRTIDLDLAAIIYTSGSTGEPRGVMLSHRNLVANARSIVRYLALTSGDRVMCVLPFHYVYGLSLLHTHIAVGGSVVIDNRFAFPNVVLGAMRDHSVTGFAGVPSTFALLLHRSNLETADLPALRYVTQAGGGMPVPRILAWLDRGPRVPFYVMYGATEAGARLAYLPPDNLRAKLGSIGRAIPNVEIQVIADNGQPAAVREVGELVARGTNIAAGYWNAPRETQEKFGPLGYRTGDLGYMDEDGYLFLVGRRHDMIKVGANRIGAKEVEDVLSEHAAVHEAAVVAAAHELLGEVPVAFVSLRAPLADASKALTAHCASRLPPYKLPSRIEICGELPKLPGAGKIDKQRLRQLAATSPGSRQAT
jgi:acyl-CoA synthetase (AMP-forming)/AMP-acid ligase II